MYIAVEGTLDEIALKRLISTYRSNIPISPCLGKKGKDYLRSNLLKFNQIAHNTPFLILVDLDNQQECAPELLRQWLPHPALGMNLRVAVRELESWLLADRENLAAFLSIQTNRIPASPDQILNPKLELINLARRSRRKEIRADLIPAAGSTSQVGRNYNGKLTEFIINYWNIEIARSHSPSLDGTIKAIESIATS